MVDLAVRRAGVAGFEGSAVKPVVRFVGGLICFSFLLRNRQVEPGGGGLEVAPWSDRLAGFMGARVEGRLRLVRWPRRRWSLSDGEVSLLRLSELLWKGFQWLDGGQVVRLW